MSAIIGNNIQIKEILKATGYDCPAGLEGKTFNEATQGGGGGGSEDKLLCYYFYNGSTYSCVVYTDKPATRVVYGELRVGEGVGTEVRINPVDKGNHLFMTDAPLPNMTRGYQFVNLVYEDGSPATDLKGKFNETYL